MLTLPVSLIRSPLALPSRLTLESYPDTVARERPQFGLWLLRGMGRAVAMPRQLGLCVPSRVTQNCDQGLSAIRPIRCCPGEYGRNAVSERN